MQMVVWALILISGEDAAVVGSFADGGVCSENMLTVAETQSVSVERLQCHQIVVDAPPSDEPII